MSALVALSARSPPEVNVLILKDSEVAEAIMEQLRSRMMLQSIEPLFCDRDVVVAERKGR